jgi:hypothetical protein
MDTPLGTELIAWLHGVEAAQTTMTAAAISAAHDDGGIARDLSRAEWVSTAGSK